MGEAAGLFIVWILLVIILLCIPRIYRTVRKEILHRRQRKLNNINSYIKDLDSAASEEQIDNLREKRKID